MSSARPWRTTTIVCIAGAKIRSTRRKMSRSRRVDASCFRRFSLLSTRFRWGISFPTRHHITTCSLQHLDRVKPVPVQTGPNESFHLEPALLAKVMAAKKLQAFLIGNPCNPTGDLIQDGELKAYLAAARKNKCTLVMDESYSHFIYGEGRYPREWAGIRGGLRKKRGEGAGAHRRRTEQELPVSGVAAELGGGDHRV